MVFAVADSTGEVLGLFRMPDATVFSIDVAVAKARNVAYYTDPAQLAADRPGARACPPGTSFTNRTFRYLAVPRFPEGIDGSAGPVLDPQRPRHQPGHRPASRPAAAGQRLPERATASTPSTPARTSATRPTSPTRTASSSSRAAPASTRTWAGTVLVGGFGVSGDGVDQDDVVTSFGIRGFEPPSFLRADQFKVFGVRLPYQKFPRNPEG